MLGKRKKRRLTSTKPVPCMPSLCLSLSVNREISYPFPDKKKKSRSKPALMFDFTEKVLQFFYPFIFVFVSCPWPELCLHETQFLSSCVSAHWLSKLASLCSRHGRGNCVDLSGSWRNKKTRPCSGGSFCVGWTRTCQGNAKLLLLVWPPLQVELFCWNVVDVGIMTLAE